MVGWSSLTTHGSHCIARRVPEKHIPREDLSRRGREPVESVRPLASEYLRAPDPRPARASARLVLGSAAPWDRSVAVRRPYSTDRPRRRCPRRPLFWHTYPTGWAF